MTRKQLVALRTMVALAEHHVRSMGRTRHRLEWTKVMRHARRALNKVTMQWIEAQYDE